MAKKADNPVYDCLKYWRVIRQYIKVKYGLTQSDLDMILFLNSEGYFSRDKFLEYNKLLSWDKERFDRLLKEEWFFMFRKRRGRFRALYGLTPKARKVVTSIYDKLSGAQMPTSPSQNPMFLKNVSYSDKMYRQAIMEMNAAIKQQQRHAPE